jgi:hypothetical protein
MALYKGCSDALYSLGSYYNIIENNYDLMKKYYLVYYKNNSLHYFYSNSCKECIIRLYNKYKKNIIFFYKS